MTSENQARFIAEALFGDEEHRTPQGTLAYTYFQEMQTEEAWAEFRQMYWDMSEGDRPRDLMERMDEDR